jgi:cell division protein FtsL
MSTWMNQARSRVPRIADAAVERARLTVVPRAATRAARVPFVALVSLLLVAGVAGLLFFNTSMQQVSFTATALENRAQSLDAERQGLQMELDTLRDPQRVALQAKRMGMVPPASPAFISLGTGRVLGKPLPAVGADAMRVTSRPTVKPKNLSPRPKVITAAKKKTAGGASTGSASTATGTKKNPTR